MNKTTIFFIYIKENIDTYNTTITNSEKQLVLQISGRKHFYYPKIKERNISKTPIYFIYVKDNHLFVISCFYKDNSIYILFPDKFNNQYISNILQTIAHYSFANIGLNNVSINILNGHDLVLSEDDIFEKIVAVTNYIFKNSKKHLTMQEALDYSISKNLKMKISRENIIKIIRKY